MNPAPNFADRLPAELWVDIFGRCFHKCTITTDCTQKPPFSFGQVCQRWRDIVSHTPILWTKISLNLGLSVFRIPWDGPYSNRARPVETHSATNLLALILSRSQNAPLEVDIMADSADQVPTHIFRHTLNLLLEHSHRWRQAEFDVAFHHLTDLESSKYSFPQLEKLSLYLEPVPTRPRPIGLFQNAPVLSDIDLIGFPPSNRNSPNPGQAYLLPWRQLTNLSLRIQETEDPLLIMGALRYTPNLTTLLASISPYALDTNGSWQLESRVSLPFLTFLSVICDKDVHWSIATHIVAPNLKKLETRGLSFHPIATLLQVSGCTLESLCVCRLEKLSMDQVVTFVNHFGSQVRSFTLPYSSPVDREWDDIKDIRAELEQFLEQKLTRKNLLPRLEEFVIQVQPSLSALPAGIRTLLAQRRELKVRVRCVLYYGDEYFRQNRIDEITRLCQEVGCEVAFEEID